MTRGSLALALTFALSAAARTPGASRGPTDGAPVTDAWLGRSGEGYCRD
jgi:hypothetical protein